MSNDTPAVRLGGSMRRAPVRGPDPDSRGAKAYVRALRRLGVQPASAEKPERRRPS
ncbi:hypothetical protein [Solicola sp. PLA-1-18]|uniref:hypothetical protein n=1 Tax=Solicola sp. PLA-1-18 TaxID=3380532 RepID=UPI003B7BDC65